MSDQTPKYTIHIYIYSEYVIPYILKHKSLNQSKFAIWKLHFSKKKY